MPFEATTPIFPIPAPAPDFRDADELANDEAWVMNALRRTRAYLKMLAVTEKLNKSFNMDNTCSAPVECGYAETEAFECGAAACIGGHAFLLGQGFDVSGRVQAQAIERASDFTFAFETSPYFEHAWQRRVSRLFYPQELWGNWSDILPSEAVVAIDNFFNGADYPWDGVFEDGKIPCRDRDVNDV